MVKDRATGKQLTLAIFIIGVAMKLFLLPALLLKMAGRDSYLAMASYMAVDLLILLCLLLVMQKLPNMTINELLEGFFGKIIAKIVISAVIIYCLFKLTLITIETRVFFESTVFEDFNWAIMALPLMAIVVVIGCKSLAGIGRIIEIFTPYLVVCIIAFAIIVAPFIEYSNVLPIMYDGTASVGAALLKFPVWVGDYILLMAFMGKLNIGGKTAKSSKSKIVAHKIKVRWGMISALVAASIVIFFSIVLSASYGNVNKLLEYGNNISNMTQYSLGGQTSGRFDVLLFSTWIVAMLIKLFLYMYMSVNLLVYVTSFGNKLILSTIIGVSIYILTITVFVNEGALFALAMGIPRYLAVFVQMLLPIVLLLISRLKRNWVKK